MEKHSNGNFIVEDVKQKMKCECENEMQWNFFEKRYDCIKCGKVKYPHEIKNTGQQTLR